MVRMGCCGDRSDHLCLGHTPAGRFRHSIWHKPIRECCPDHPDRCFGIAFPFFLYRTGLDVQLSSEAIHLRFWPFHFKPRTFYFSDIDNAEAVTYSPLKDYGGWGIRYGAKGKAYNVSGNQGVVITLETGQSILIGSQRHEELSSLINDRF